MEALCLCGADHLAARSPLTLSFGEQHRVTLASVLAPQPELLLLDEPFAGLDFSQRYQILCYPVRTARALRHHRCYCFT